MFLMRKLSKQEWIVYRIVEYSIGLFHYLLESITSMNVRKFLSQMIFHDYIDNKSTVNKYWPTCTLETTKKTI